MYVGFPCTDFRSNQKSSKPSLLVCFYTNSKTQPAFPYIPFCGKHCKL